eukprot:356907-Chlamydomonas_euryale.AAC.10
MSSQVAYRQDNVRESASSRWKWPTVNSPAHADIAGRNRLSPSGEEPGGNGRQCVSNANAPTIWHVARRKQSDLGPP